MEQTGTAAATGEGDAAFRRLRIRMIAEIAVSFVVAIGAWRAITHWMAPIPAMGSAPDRLIFALKLTCVVTLFCLVTGVEAVAHERLRSPAIDPLTGYTTRRMTVNLRYLQNTLEQLAVFVPGLFGMAFYARDGGAMRAVVAAAVVWIASRLAFWIGYHQGAEHRGPGVVGMLMGMLMLLYVCMRFGQELAGTVGEIVPILVFISIEAYLFIATRPAPR